jgi:hypothetical protein
LQLRGDGSQAVGLVQLVRSKTFHGDKGDEVIWRIELWYFKNEYGGWSKIAQVNKVVRRERFKTEGDYQAATARLEWIPDLGGIMMPKGDAGRTISLPLSGAVGESGSGAGGTAGESPSAVTATQESP